MFCADSSELSLVAYVVHALVTKYYVLAQFRDLNVEIKVIFLYEWMIYMIKSFKITNIMLKSFNYIYFSDLLILPNPRNVHDLIIIKVMGFQNIF